MIFELLYHDLAYPHDALRKLPENFQKTNKEIIFVKKFQKSSGVILGSQLYKIVRGRYINYR